MDDQFDLDEDLVEHLCDCCLGSGYVVLDDDTEEPCEQCLGTGSFYSVS